MKETPLSLSERSSLISNLEAKLRLDGRGFNDVRPIDIYFGKDYGCCTVNLGETRVLSQVTCSVVVPRPSRPNEGKLSISIRLSPMAAPHFETGKGHGLMDELQQILDRNIKESKCVDLESLCIMAEESVWQLKVDVTVLNHAGNLADACNISAVAALRHFHRPDVTVEEDGRVTIHSADERDLIPTFLKRIPVCLSYALFASPNDKKLIAIADPTEKEERVMSGKLIVGLNPHGEVTSLIFPGKVCVEKQFIMSCISKTYIKAKSIAEKVMTAVEDDLEKRKSGQPVLGFLNLLKSDSEYNLNRIMERIADVEGLKKSKDDVEEMVEEETDVKMEVVETSQQDIEEEKTNKESDESDEEFSQESLRMSLPEVKAQKANKKKKKNKKNLKNEVDDETDTQSYKLNVNEL